MFVLTTTYSNTRFVTKDTAALESRILSITRNEAEAKRISSIASNMRIGDVFHNPEMHLKCRIGEDI